MPLLGRRQRRQHRNPELEAQAMNAPPLSFHHEFWAPRPKPLAPMQLNHGQGPHRAQIGPTAGTIATGAYPDHLFLGLLTKLPASDGTQLIELNSTSYTRQLITLTPLNATYFCVPRPILFEVNRLPVVAGFGIFDHETGGAICGYGAISARKFSREPVELIEVPTHHLLVNRIGTEKHDL